MQRLHAHLVHGVRREDVFARLGRLAHLADGTGIVPHVVLTLEYLLVELHGDHVEDDLVKVLAAQILVPAQALDGHGACCLVLLANDLLEANHGHLVGGRAQIEQHDVGRLLRELLLLIEAKLERERAALVHEREHVEAGNLGGVVEGHALEIAEERGNGDDAVAHRAPRVALGNLFRIREHEGDHLLAAECAVL
mmetsp:Transcript_1853/g.3727  ORF Transcript_1853/g.3727 Transcript_1853/m.3727 type:complete len:195 (+) Transcript_1853:1414-1998(+)